MWRAKRKIQRLPGLFEMGGPAVFPLKEALWVSYMKISVTGVLEGLDSRLLGRNGQ